MILAIHMYHHYLSKNCATPEAVNQNTWKCGDLHNPHTYEDGCSIMFLLNGKSEHLDKQDTIN